MRYQKIDDQLYISVTSAMKLVKLLLAEEKEYAGPLMRIHQAEGDGCHALCLNWLAKRQGWISDYILPPKPAYHPDLARWEQTLSAALIDFIDFVVEYEVEALGIEQEVLSPSLGLIGHLDLYAWMRFHGKRIRAIIDLKFVAKILPSHLLQVRCYYHCDGLERAQAGFIYHAPRVIRKGFQLVPVDLNQGLDDVMAVSYAAQFYRWALQKNLLKEERIS